MAILSLALRPIVTTGTAARQRPASSSSRPRIGRWFGSVIQSRHGPRAPGGPILTGVRPLIVASVLTAALLVAAAMPAAAETTPTPDGNVIKINIAVDVFAGKNARTGPDGTPIDEYFKTVVKNTWGAAFDKLPLQELLQARARPRHQALRHQRQGPAGQPQDLRRHRDPGGGRASAGTASPKRRAATARAATASARSRTTARGTSR